MVVVRLITKRGHVLGLNLPVRVLAGLGWREGDSIVLEVDGDVLRCRALKGILYGCDKDEHGTNGGDSR